jgi:glycosyltransferase involved in cell wall biosynthesis
MTNPIELTILMPCLNEAETLGACIEKARLGVERSGVRAEILVADNGSQDASVQIAKQFGVCVVHVEKIGLIHGAPVATTSVSLFPASAIAQSQRILNSSIIFDLSAADRFTARPSAHNILVIRLTYRDGCKSRPLM